MKPAIDRARAKWNLSSYFPRKYLLKGMYIRSYTKKAVILARLWFVICLSRNTIVYCDTLYFIFALNVAFILLIIDDKKSWMRARDKCKLRQGKTCNMIIITV